MKCILLLLNFYEFCFILFYFITFTFLGTSDFDNQFHLIGLCLTKGEEEKDYEFGFQAIIHGLNKLEAQDTFQPSVLVSDAATAIGNAAKKVFGPNILVRMCYYHFITCVTKKAKGKWFLHQLKRELYSLWMAPSTDVFEEMVEKFIEKYENIDKPFSDYFKVSIAVVCIDFK